MLHQKMRPYRFDDMIGQEVTVENIRIQAQKDIWFQVYLLVGQYGSGKTTMARIIALAANCLNRDERGNPCLRCEGCRTFFQGNPDIREIDGASNTGVDNIRDLKEWMEYKPLGRYKVAIIDEVHMLSTNAFNSLLKMLEEPPAYAIFILGTTDKDSIPLTVRSRSAVYAFGQISAPLIAAYLRSVAEINNIVIDGDSCALIAKRSSGAMRNALVYLEQLSASGIDITGALCKQILGISSDQHIFLLLEAFLSHNVPGFVDIVRKLGQVGKNFSVVAGELVEACSDLIVASSGFENIDGTSEYRRLVSELAGKYKLSEFCELSEQIMIVRQSVKEDESQNWFIVNGITVIQHMKNDVSKIHEELETFKRQLIGLGHGDVQETSPPSKGMTELALEEDEELHFAIMADQSKTPDTVANVDIALGESSFDVSVPSQLAVEEDDDIFDDDEFFASVEGAREGDFHVGYNNSNSLQSVSDDNLTSDNIVPKSEPAELTKAEIYNKQLIQLGIENPEIDVHLKLCHREYEEKRLVLVAPDQAICNLLLLFFGRQGITNFDVRC